MAVVKVAGGYIRPAEEAKKLTPMSVNLPGVGSTEAYIAVCRIQEGVVRGKPGYQLQVLVKNGVRHYIGGGVSYGPIFVNVEKSEASDAKAAEQACIEAAKRLGFSEDRIRVVYPQRAPKMKVGNAAIARLLGPGAVSRIKHANSLTGHKGKKIAVLPAGLLGVLAAGKVRTRAKVRK